MGPGGIAMRIVRRPHYILSADQLAVFDADLVIHEGRVDLAPEILTRQQREIRPYHVPVALPRMIHPREEMRQPADIVLGRDKSQFGETVEHAPKDQRA